MNLKILQRDESLKIIKNSEFTSKWDLIAKESNEFTLIQEPDLVVSWYEAYKSEYDPILVIAYKKDSEEVVGVLPLAISIADGGLSHAGDGQAEYNGWVCKSEYEEKFLIQSLILLKEAFHLSKWDWGWMPPQANTDWLNSDKLKANGITVSIGSCESPVYDLHDQQRIEKIKKSKSTKSKINRLKRSGELKIERITDSSKAKEIFIDLKMISNFRNLAVYDNMPFSSDNSCKEDWHLNHLDGSDSVHFTVLWQGDELLACNFGFCSEDTVIIGLFTYNPVQGAHSPGNAFLIELLSFIEKEGFRYLDLSPGGDPYKERFSNTHNTLFKPTFCFNNSCKYKNKVTTYLKNKVKEKYSYRDILSIKSKLERKISEIKSIPRNLINKENMLFQFVSEEGVTSSFEFNLQKYQDLLLYKYRKGNKKHSEVIFSSLKNFERGDLLFTLVENNILIFSAWISVSTKKHWNKNLDRTVKDIGANILIYDIYLNADSKNSQLLFEFAAMINTEYTSADKLSDLYLVTSALVNSKLLLDSGFNLADLSEQK